MAIDFSFPPEIEKLRERVREYIEDVVLPAEREIEESGEARDVLIGGVKKMRREARERSLWLPHMPEEYGGMGLGHVAMAAVSAEAARARFGRPVGHQRAQVVHLRGQPRLLCHSHCPYRGRARRPASGKFGFSR